MPSRRHPATSHNFPCADSFEPLRSLTFQHGPSPIARQILRGAAILHLRPVDLLPGRLPRVRRMSPSSETKCCAPAERCGTAQYFGQRKESDNPQNEMVTASHAGSHKYTWLHCQDVGPLQYNDRGAPNSPQYCTKVGKVFTKQSQPNSHTFRTTPQLCQSTTTGHNAQHHSPP